MNNPKNYHTTRVAATQTQHDKEFKDGFARYIYI